MRLWISTNYLVDRLLDVARPVLDGAGSPTRSVPHVDMPRQSDAEIVAVARHRRAVRAKRGKPHTDVEFVRSEPWFGEGRLVVLFRIAAVVSE
jgi:hypothetical protein